MNRINYKIIIATVSMVILGTASCKKAYLDTEPTHRIPEEKVGESIDGLKSMVTGLHYLFNNRMDNTLSNHAQWGVKGLDLGEDMMYEDMVAAASSPYEWFIFHYQYVSTESPTYWMPYNIWTLCYRIINNANMIIGVIDNAENPDLYPTQYAAAKGQALAYRAWAYHKLLVCFSHNIKYIQSNPQFDRGVPLYLKSVEGDNIEHIGRGKATDVMAQAQEDIVNAIELLDFAGTAAVGSSKSNISANVARGLASRIALVNEQWQDAATFAADARVGYPLMTGSDLTSGMNNRELSEYMWCGTQTSEENNRKGILCFISWMDDAIPGYAGAGAERKITKFLYDQIDNDDIRKSWWSSSMVQNKFRSKESGGFDFDDLFMRSAEMYYNEAEARFNLNDHSGARDVLEEVVSTRLPGYSAASLSGNALLNEIYIQRRIELWGEGFGFQDMRRRHLGLNRPTGAGNHSAPGAIVLTLPANSPRFLFKLPQNEMDNNRSMTPEDQNP